MKFLPWLFIIILCAQALPSLALETFSTTRDRDSVLSETHLQEHEANGVNGGSNSEVSSLKEPKVYSKAGHQGKGSNGGGATIDHQPRSEKNAASVPKSSLFFILSPTILCTGISWIFLFPF